MLVVPEEVPRRSESTPSTLNGLYSILSTLSLSPSGLFMCAERIMKRQQL